MNSAPQIYPVCKFSEIFKHFEILGPGGSILPFPGVKMGVRVEIWDGSRSLSILDIIEDF